MRLNHLILETTRRCQLECAHCLRGNSRSCDMDFAHIEQMLEGITSINMLTFTGGEPFLNVSIMEQTLAYCKEHHIEVDIFYVVTNGIIFEDFTPLSERCMRNCMEWYFYANDKEMSGVGVSRTKWHRAEHDLKENLILDAFKFAFEHSETSKWNEHTIILEGRGANIGRGLRQAEYKLNMNYPEEIEVYLNCDGMVVWGCDLSYDTQDEVEITIAEAKKVLLEAEKMVEEENSSYAN